MCAVAGTYEANLFGLVFLMSSAVIYNTMYPIDASTARRLSSHCAHALRILKELHERGAWALRTPPRLVRADGSHHARISSSEAT
jgi:hypothetical protein